MQQVSTFLEAVRGKVATLSTSPRRRLVRGYALLPLLVYAVGFLLAESMTWLLAFALSPKVEASSPLFIQGAVVVAALLLVAPRRWWLYLALTLPLLVANAWLFHRSPSWSVVWTLLLLYLAIVSLALGTAALLRRFVTTPMRFASAREVSRFVLCVCGGAILPAYIVTVGRVLIFDWTFWFSWETAYFGYVLAITLFTPAIVLWATTDVLRLRATAHQRSSEAMFLVLGLLVISVFVFGVRYQGSGLPPALIYLLVPLLLWAAVRFGPRGIASSLALITLVAIIGATRGVGPFVGYSAVDNVFALQLFLVFVGVPLFYLAAVTQQQAAAEEGLRASEIHYRTVVRNLPRSAVLLFDAELRHSFADGPGLLLLGLSPELLEGRTVWEAFPRDLAAALAPAYEAAVSGQASELDVEHAQQIYRIQVVPMSDTWPLVPATSAIGSVPVGMVVLRDITEQRRARDELVRERTLTAVLAARNQEFRTLAEHSPDLIARLDPIGRVQYINPAGADLLPQSVEHWIGKTIAEAGVSEDVAARWAERLHDVVTTHVPRTFDVEVHSPPVGQLRSLHVRFVPELVEDAEDAEEHTLRSVLVIATDVSALKQAEARLAEEASEHEAIFEAQADGVGVYDLQARFVRANTALYDLLGLEVDAEYPSLPLEERSQRLLLFDEEGRQLPPEQWPQWRVLRGEILAGANAVETRVRTLDGRELWISITGAPVRAVDGQATGTVLIARDVTARRALERQVAEQAAQLAAIFEAMADGVFVLDAQGRMTHINPAARALFKLATGEDRAPEEIDPTATERAKALVLRDGTGHPPPVELMPTRRLLRGEVLAGATAQTLQIGTRPERMRTISLTGGPLRDAMGQIVGAVGVVRDVTELQRVQAALAEQERLFRTLVEHSPDIIARFDRELRYLYVSPAIRQVSPMQEAAYIGKTNAELGWPESAYASAHRAIEQVFQTGHPQALEEIDASDGDPATAHHFRAQILPECAADGRVESVLAVTTDITTLKRTEQALREANASLEIARQAEERRKQIAESLRGVLTILNSTRSPREVLQYIVRQAEALLGSAAAVIYGPDLLTNNITTQTQVEALATMQDGDRATSLRVQAAEGLRIGGRRPRPLQHLPFADVAVEQVLMAAQPVAVVDGRSGLVPRDHVASESETAEAHATAGDRDVAIALLDGELPAPYQALLVVPIRVHDRLYGCLLLLYPQSRRFEAEEVALAQAYADQVALAITNTRLQVHLEQEAAAAERNRLAQELHDTVKQELFSASLVAQSLPTVWQTHRTKAEAALQQLHAMTQSAYAGLQALLLELRPAALEKLPLAESLRQLAAAMSTRAGVPVVVEGSATLEPPLPATVKIACYRVAQEALMNAVKYAHAHAIRMRLRTKGANWLELELADDGRGFDPEGTPIGHFGLAIMRERAQAVGASLQVRSHAGQGTVVSMTWRRGRSVGP